MTPEEQEGLCQLLADERGAAARAAQDYHLGLAEEEGGPHYGLNSWSDCFGCRSDNPHYEQAKNG